MAAPKGKRKKIGVAESDKFAPGYVPHPTKTMWERHRDMYNLEDTVPIDEMLMPRIDHREAPQPRLYFGRAPKTLKPLKQVLQEVKETKRKFTQGELKHHFGFTKDMIRRFREAERDEAVNKEAPKKWAHLAKRRKEREDRDERMLTMRLASSSLSKK